MSYIVKLETKRVQTYLFGIPELKCMVGANTILGEVLRGKLDGGGNTHSLAGLAIAHGSCLPDGAVAKNAPALKSTDSNDPLHRSCSPDNPKLAWSNGILARDGGHFIAVFPDLDKAKSFVADVSGLMASRLPGLGYEVRLSELSRNANNQWVEGEDLADVSSGSLGKAAVDFPQAQTCDVAKQGIATVTHKGDHLSLDVKQRREAADRFNRNDSYDVLGLIKSSVGAIRFPADFSKMARSGYLAVIVADGNGMGARIPTSSEFPDFFRRQQEIEHYFYGHRFQMRMAVRDCLSDILKSHQQDPTSEIPIRPMMLGGDDLVLACDAPKAFDLVKDLCRRVGAADRNSGKKFSLGVGIAIVKASFPFHRAHALAEQLAASAKVKWRVWFGQNANNPLSVVDWLVTSEAWHDDLEATRVRDAVKVVEVNGTPERLILSRRPYFVESAPKVQNDPNSLTGLLSIRNNLLSSKVARSQIMHLCDTLPLGKRQGIEAVRDLPEPVRSALAPVLCGSSPWDAHGTTGLLDLLDIHEILKLDPRNVSP